MTLSPSFINDALRAVRNNKHETVGDGRVLIPGTGMFLGGFFRHAYAPPGEDFGPWTTEPNRVTDQGLNKVLNLLAGHASSAALYIAPFSGAVTPAAGWTGANFTANATEFVAYTPATRPAWTTVASTAKSLTNAAALAASTITFTAGTHTIRGAGLLEAAAKSATTGACVAASRFGADITGMILDGKLALEYGMGAVDEADA